MYLEREGYQYTFVLPINPFKDTPGGLMYSQTRLIVVKFLYTSPYKSYLNLEGPYPRLCSRRLKITKLCI